MKKFFIFTFALMFVVIAIILYNGLKPIAVVRDSSSLNPMEEPIQQDLTQADPILFKDGKFNLIYQPVADYSITARILGKKRYSGDWSAQVAKYDFAFGWGDMSIPEMTKGIAISQSMRFYFYRTKPDCQLTLRYIVRHSANNHLIPANRAVKKALASIKKGDIVRIDGKLIKVSGWYDKQTVTWGTSTTRNDTGNGACELIYVQKVFHDGKIYQ